MTLDSIPDTSSPRNRCAHEHLDLERRTRTDQEREAEQLLGARRALLASQAREHATTAGRGFVVRVLTELRHGWQLLALALRAVSERSGLDRREVVDFVAQERRHAWDEGFRLPY